MNTLDHISESLETFFLPIKILKFFDADEEGGSGSGNLFGGMEKIWIQDKQCRDNARVSYPGSELSTHLISRTA
jgi:hypothetical protein